jgi:hypothetical protein
MSTEWILVVVLILSVTASAVVSLIREWRSGRGKMDKR